MNAHVLTVGSEILAGDIHDTNFREIAETFREVGIQIRHHESVPDEIPAISRAIRRALEDTEENHGLILLTGGLGPTPDDLTREGVAHALGVKQAIQEPLADELRRRFESAGYGTMPESNYRQVDLPVGAQALANPLGSAPGFAIRQGKAWIVAVPGVPQEMRFMVREEVIPLLIRESGLVPLRVRVLRTQGIRESSLAEKIEGLLDPARVEIGFYPKNPGVDLKLTARGAGQEADRILDEAEAKLRECLHPAVYGLGSQTLSACIGELLRDKGWKVALAESCTGGSIASMLISTPGASDYFERGVVSYSNAAKVELLGVPGDLIEKYGAVSTEVAQAMAQGLLERSGVDITLATTGIAGPGGGSEEKPVGLVWVAIATAGGVESWDLRSHGDRATVIRRSSVGALNRLRLVLGI